MKPETLGWIQIVGGALALIYPGGGTNMMGMMGFGSYSMMSGGWAVTILALLFIITGFHHVLDKK